MPSTSGRAATYPKRSDKLKFFNELKDLRDTLRREKEEREGGAIGSSASAQPADYNSGGVSSSHNEQILAARSSVCSTTEPQNGTNCMGPSNVGSPSPQVSKKLSVIVKSPYFSHQHL